eukprot:TRINITY_DN26002_c0_g1_i1.p1 TRINITY_DN26002_c0_g1~~TRINITY_DN26002_c0_g1_i1.p1  ORF type:complete len:597 (-),score=102.26 TRINITY_DN26002_c0_g1_i1:115-1905(-)
MISYDESWMVLMLCKCEGSVAGRATMFALPASILCFCILYLEEAIEADFQETLRIQNLNSSILWTSCSGMMVVLLGFRTNRSMSRFWEGTGLLHQMRGEWFDSISCLATFSRMSMKDRKDEVVRFRHTLVRLMSLCHGTALAEIAGSDPDSVATIDAIGLDDETLFYLHDCRDKYNFNRVEVLVHLIQTIIVGHLENGIIKIPPPILSRVFQTLSRGFVNLLNAKKIADTCFPFPYAQTIAILLLMHLVWTPICMACVVKDLIWGPIMTFIPIFTFFSINFIGMQLENPFGDEPNDLPLDHFQREMNSCLLMLLQDGSDHMPSVEAGRYEDFESLAEAFREEEQNEEHVPHVGRLSSFAQMQKTISKEDIVLEVAAVSSKRLSHMTAALMSEVAKSKAAAKKQEPTAQDARVPTEAKPPEEAKTSSTQDTKILPTAPVASAAAVKEGDVALEPLAAARLQDFRGALENWTCSIEQQLVDLNLAFKSASSLTNGDSISPHSPSSQQLETINLVVQDLQAKETRPMLLQLARGIDKCLEQWQVMFERQAMELSRTFAELTVFTRSIAKPAPMTAETTGGSLPLHQFDSTIDTFLNEQG